MTEPFDDLGMQTPQEDIKALLVLLGMVSWTVRDARVRVVEVGSWAGRTALAMADLSPQVKVWCVDHWQGNLADQTSRTAAGQGPYGVFPTFCKNVGPRLFDSIIPCRGPSALWAPLWPFAADLIFIDADHSYEAVQEDIRLWAPHVRQGGILCGHDYGTVYLDGLVRAVDEFGKDGVLGATVWFKRM